MSKIDTSPAVMRKIIDRMAASALELNEMGFQGEAYLMEDAIEVLRAVLDEKMQFIEAESQR